MKKRCLPLLLALLLLCCACNIEITYTPPVSTPAGGETLTVHFIDVGQADSALLECGGETMLIDGGNAEDSSLLVTYLREEGIDTLDHVVCTHAHEDHVGGLSGPLNTVTVNHVYAPVTEYDSKVFTNFVRYTENQGLPVEIPQPGDTFSLGSAAVTILGPVKEYEETNDTSIVLRVDFGDTSFLFTGDMETAAEYDLIAAGAPLDATVLKVGHHGSNTSSSYQFLREVMPDYAVISVGEGNSYGHPTDAVLSRLRDEEATVYRTDMQGTVIAVSDGTQVTFTTETGSDAQTIPDNLEGSNSTTYIGNTNSKKFHTADCSNLPSERNRTTFPSFEAATAAGYTPCGSCLG